MSKQFSLQCTECGHPQAYQIWGAVACESCGSPWMQAHYDYASFKRDLLRGLPNRPTNLWRYQDVLPILAPDSLDLIDAGGTPLRHSRAYAQSLEHGLLYIKDERHGPTSSFKDRQAAVSVAAMIEAGVYECVIASTGNAGVAYASACARAGIKLWVFMTNLVPQEKLREAALFGAEVVKVDGNYDQTKQIAADFATRRGLFLDRGARSLPACEAFKTIAYEIVEQLGWQAPNWYVQAVSGGLGPLGVYRGFQELYAMGLIDRIPALAVIQTEGCAPMVRAFKAGQDVAEPVVPDTRIAILTTGDPGPIYTQLRRIIQRYGGMMESVSDEHAFAAMHTLAGTEGMAVEPAAAVAFAGLEKLIRSGSITGNEVVVVNCSGHTFPVEKHVLGDQWHVAIHLSHDQRPVPYEGLQMALEHLEEKTTTVLLIDDNPDDRLLLRRLLEARKSYRVYCAKDGLDGVEQARHKLPDLIILDLTMPQLDGFGVLSELKSDPHTGHIPIIVVTARDIDVNERQRLSGQIVDIYQKGSLPPRAFVDRVVQILEKKIAYEGVET